MLKLTQKKGAPKRELTILGKFIKILLIATAVIFVWRGIWGIADVLLFPNNYFLSSASSLVIGIIILALTHAGFKELV